MTHTTLDPTRTVGALVVENPSLARVLDDLRIDYCCGGDVTLDEACARRGLDRDEVIHALEQAETSPSDPEDGLDLTTLTLGALVDHIEQAHHSWLRRELPKLRATIDKVIAAHGSKDVRLADLGASYHDLCTELDMHLQKEEQVLFPLIRMMERAGSRPDFHCGLSDPIGVMESEHENVGAMLEEFRKLTDGFRAPEHACPTYHAMLDGLKGLEHELHRHVHEENNVLHPRALAMFEKFAADA